jgi:hypothetical protein
MPSRWSHRRFCRMTATLAACGASLGALPGCQIVGIVGAMAQSAEEMGSTVYPAEYVGLDDHSYAVIISADRVIESDNPGITARLTQIIDRDLKANTQATAHIPAGRLLSKLYADPSWQALPRGELAEKLGVERLVVVEVVEYRLHEPGNRYTWDGVASGVVEVYEIRLGAPRRPHVRAHDRGHLPRPHGPARRRSPQGSRSPASSADASASASAGSSTSTKRRTRSRTDPVRPADRPGPNAPNRGPRHAHTTARTTILLAAGVIAPAVALLPGCNIVGPVVMIAQGPGEVEKVYELDRDKKTVIFVDDPANKIAQRRTRSQIGEAAQNALMRRKKVREENMIDTRSAMSVAANGDDTLSITEIGQAVGAEIIIYALITRSSSPPTASRWILTPRSRSRSSTSTTHTRLYPPPGQPGYRSRFGGQRRSGNSFMPTSRTDLLRAQTELARITGEGLSQLFYDVEVPQSLRRQQ